MVKLKELKKEFSKDDIWGVILTLLLLLNIIIFFFSVNTDRHITLNYIATTMCSFALGLWLRKS